MFKYVITIAIISTAALTSTRTACWLRSLLTRIFRYMGLIHHPFEEWFNKNVTTLTASGETLREYFYYRPYHPFMASIIVSLFKCHNAEVHRYNAEC